MYPIFKSIRYIYLINLKPENYPENNPEIFKNGNEGLCFLLYPLCRTLLLPSLVTETNTNFCPKYWTEVYDCLLLLGISKLFKGTEPALPRFLQPQLAGLQAKGYGSHWMALVCHQEGHFCPGHSTSTLIPGTWLRLRPGDVLPAHLSFALIDNLS